MGMPARLGAEARRTGRLYVCTTCVRDQPLIAGISAGRRLAHAIDRGLPSADLGAGFAVQAVLCLSGCPHPCTAALRGQGKWTIRLSRLTAEDAAGIVALACAYAASLTGDIPPDQWPPGLIDKVSVRTPPFDPAWQARS